MKSKKKKVTLKANQFSDMKKWILFYNKNGKLPIKEIYCSSCKKDKVALGNAAIKKLLLDNEKFPTIKDVLEKTHCKLCRKFERQQKRLIEKKEKAETEEYVPKPTKFLTRQELEDRAEKIRAELPRVNVLRPITTVFLQRNREECEKATKDVCIRPDIFLVNRDCDNCKLNLWCICPIKKFSRHYEIS